MKYALLVIGFIFGYVIANKQGEVKQSQIVYCLAKNVKCQLTQIEQAVFFKEVLKWDVIIVLLKNQQWFI